MKAVVVGAGPAGLTAAHALLAEVPGAEVDVFEASDTIGGISATLLYKGNRIDIGGHRFFSKSGEVNAYWEKIMPLQGAGARDDLALGTEKVFAPNGPDPEKADDVMLIRRRVSRIYFGGKFFDYPITMGIQTLCNMGILNTVSAGVSYLWSAVWRKPEVSLEDFYINRFGACLYRLFFEHYTEKVWGIHPSRLSASWGAQRVKGLSVAEVIKEAVAKRVKPGHRTRQTSLIESFLYPKKGPGQLWERVADQVTTLGGRIHLGRRVTEVHTAAGRVVGVRVSGPDGERSLACDAVFSSMPVKELVAAIGAQGGSVPEDIATAAKALPYRDFMTVGLLVKRMALKNTTRLKTVGEIVPDCWIYVQDRSVKLGRLQIFNNWSPYMVADNEHTVWLGLEYFCNEGDSLWEMDDQAFIRLAVAECCKIGFVRKEDVLDATRVRVKKAYPAYFGTYAAMPNIRAYLDGFSNLYCIGRNGQHRYNNMDHSMLTAWEAVRAFKAGGGKESVWDVNTENAYHEKGS